MGEDVCIALPLLGQRLCAPLAQADAVAVAPRRDAEAAVLIPEGEAGAPQPQCPPEGRGGQPKPDALRGRCIPSGVAALAAAVCYGETAVLRILWMHSSVVMLLRAVLEALCAFWMLGLGLSWLRKDWKAPTRSLTLAVLGSVIFYWCVLARFMENSSSWHRVAPTAMVWQLLAGLVFLSALARALYLPGTSDGRTLCAGALASFALCLCWEVPSVVQMLTENGSAALLTPELLFRLGLCCVGVLGGLCAVRCCRAGQGA